MSNTQSCLTNDTLKQIGRDELSLNQLRAIEEHVSDCSECRELFVAASNEPNWQDQILPVLQEPRDSTIAFDEEDESLNLQSVLQLLGPTDDPSMLGRVGPYEVLSVVGRGGMGVVFKAFDGALDRYVAIKMLLPHLASSSAARKRFSREGQAAAAVIDDHVLPIFGVDHWQGIPYLVMQYSSGLSLQKRIESQGPFELKEILRISLQTARGLAAAHAQGLVHRDVKPANILLDRTVERALLTDFGLARAIDDATITRTGIVAGTPQYMSPEQVRNQPVDARSDLFSLGCTMYAMCTGRSPFRAESTYGAMHRIANEQPPPIRDLNAEIPDWLAAIIDRLMSKEPEDRFESAIEVADLLQDCLAHVQQPAVTALPEIALPSEPMAGVSTLPPNRVGRPTIITAMLFLAAIAMGFVLTINTGKGTLTIHSEVDDVGVLIRQGNDIVQQLTVSKNGTSVDVSVGKYIVEIEGTHELVEIDRNRVTMTRGGSEVVRIVHRSSQHDYRYTDAELLTTRQIQQQAEGLAQEGRIIKVRLRVDNISTAKVFHASGQHVFEQWGLQESAKKDFAIALWPGAQGPMKRLGIDFTTYYSGALVEVVGRIHRVDDRLDGFRPDDVSWKYQLVARNVDQIRVLELQKKLHGKVPTDFRALPPTAARESVASDSSIGFPGKVVVDVYCGAEVMPQMNSRGPNKAKHTKMLLALNAIKNVIVNFREAGPGNEIIHVIVRDPSLICRRESLATGGDSLTRVAISKALMDAEVPKIRWEERVARQSAEVDESTDGVSTGESLTSVESEQKTDIANTEGVGGSKAEAAQEPSEAKGGDTESVSIEQSATKATTGDLKLRFVYNGNLPSWPALQVHPKTKGIANVVVYLDPRQNDLPVAPVRKPREVILVAANREFTPRIVVVRPGDTFAISNQDRVGYLANVQFFNNQGINVTCAPGKKFTHDIRLTEPAPVPIQCNIHPGAQAWILCVDHPYVGVSDINGNVVINNLPIGRELSFRVFHESLQKEFATAKINGKPMSKRRNRLYHKLDSGVNDMGTVHVGKIP